MSSNAWRTLDLQTTGSVATVTLNRPEQRNAASNEMLAELDAVLVELADRDELAVVLLTGTGRFFCPGADIGEVAAGAGIEMVEGEPASMYDVAARLHNLPQLTVAAINGGCAGAGLGLACGCDIRVATESAKFTTAFLALGVAGDLCLPWTLPRIVGGARARHLSFFPEKFDTADALTWGLVSAVYPDIDFAEAVDALVARLAATRPAAIRGLKQHYLTAEQMPLNAYARYEAEYNAANFDPTGFQTSES